MLTSLGLLVNAEDVLGMPVLQCIRLCEHGQTGLLISDGPLVKSVRDASR